MGKTREMVTSACLAVTLAAVGVAAGAKTREMLTTDVTPATQESVYQIEWTCPPGWEFQAGTFTCELGWRN